jgi:hypothetical protein
VHHLGILPFPLYLFIYFLLTTSPPFFQATNHQSKLIKERFLNVSTHSGGHLWQLWDLESGTLSCFAKAASESQLVTVVAVSSKHVSAVVEDHAYLWSLVDNGDNVMASPVMSLNCDTQITAMFMDESFWIIGDIKGQLSLLDKTTQSQYAFFIFC